MLRIFRFTVHFLIVTGLFTSGTAASPQKDGPAPVTPRAPVMLDGKELFSVRERVLSFSPEDRARIITERLQKLTSDPFSHSDTVDVVEGESSSDIVAGDLTIMTITDRDASAEGRTHQSLARERAATIQTALAEHWNRYETKNIVKNALFALLATVVLLALLIVFGRIFPALYRKLESWHGTKIRTLKIQAFEIINADRIVATLKALAKGCRIFLTLLLFYIYIPLAFSLFPWTHGFGAKLLHYLLAPFSTIGNAIGGSLPNMFFIIAIIVVTHYILKLISLIFAEIGKGTISIPGFFSEWAEPTFKIVRFLIIAFAAVVAFPYLPGSESPAFKGVSIFLGLLFSLGSTSAVANIVAGVILTYTRAFRIGDRVQIADTMGDVVEKTLLVTRIRTIKNVDITVPNSMVLGSHITNFSSSAQEYGLILHTSITIGYDAPWKRIHELLIEAARRTEHVLELPEPFVLQIALNDFYVNYELNAYTDHPHKMAKIYSELHQNIQDSFNEAGMEIMSPHYTQLRDGNTTTIPEEDRPAGYRPAAIRIRNMQEGTDA